MLFALKDIEHLPIVGCTSRNRCVEIAEVKVCHRFKNELHVRFVPVLGRTQFRDGTWHIIIGKRFEVESYVSQGELIYEDILEYRPIQKH